MTDVLVVGAGPTGLVLGIDLKRRGIDVRLIDALPEPVLASKGKGLQPRTLEVFDDLGVIDAVLAASCDYPVLRTYAGRMIVDERRMSELRAPTEDVPYPNIRMLPQWRTEEVLAARFRELGGKIGRGIELSRLEPNADGATATLSTGEAIRASYIVGADGGHSAVRRLARIELVGETTMPERLAVADVRTNDVDREHWHVWAKSATEIVTLCPLPGTDAFQLTASLPAGSDPDLTLALLQDLLDARAGRSDIRLSGMSWASLYRPNIRLAERFRQGRVFLAGDAAHIHPPAGGQGLNTGVQDSYNLGWKLGLALADGGYRLLDTYEEERLPIAAHVLGLSKKLFRASLAGNPDALKRGEDERQLNLTYRGSSLCAGDATGDLKPGDRMPDGRSADGRRIFDVLRGPGFAVLGYNGKVYAVRPDGYIGGIFATPDEAEAYVSALRELGRPATRRLTLWDRMHSLAGASPKRS